MKSTDQNTQVLINRSNQGTKYYRGGGYLDSQMTMKTKGLLTYFLAKPHNWRIYVSQLVKVLPEGKDAIYSSIRELVKYGHIIKTQLKDEKGCMKGVLYTVYEEPIKGSVSFSEAQENKGLHPQTEKPETVNPQLQIESLDYKNKNNNCCSLDSKEEFQQAQKYFKPHSKILEIWPSKEKPDHKREFLLKHCLSKKYFVEKDLSNALTPTQNEVVADVAATFAYGGGATELSQWLVQTIVNPRAFSNSSESFIHKLNAVITKLRIGSYTRPYALRYNARTEELARQEKLEERLKNRAWENVQSDKGMDYSGNRSDGNADLIKDLNRQLSKVNEMLKKKISQLERDSLNVLAQNLEMRKQEFAVNNFKQGRGI